MPARTPRTAGQRISSHASLLQAPARNKTRLARAHVHADCDMRSLQRHSAKGGTTRPRGLSREGTGVCASVPPTGSLPAAEVGLVSGRARGGHRGLHQRRVACAVLRTRRAPAVRRTQSRRGHSRAQTRAAGRRGTSSSTVIKSVCASTSTPTRAPSAAAAEVSEVTSAIPRETASKKTSGRAHFRSVLILKIKFEAERRRYRGRGGGAREPSARRSTGARPSASPTPYGAARRVRGSRTSASPPDPARVRGASRIKSCFVRLTGGTGRRRRGRRRALGLHRGV